MRLSIGLISTLLCPREEGGPRKWRERERESQSKNHNTHKYNLSSPTSMGMVSDMVKQLQ